MMYLTLELLSIFFVKFRVFHAEEGVPLGTESYLFLFLIGAFYEHRSYVDPFTVLRFTFSG